MPQAPTLQVDFYSQEFKRDPFPALARMRDAGPVIRLRLMPFGNVWMATTYDAVNDLLRGHQRFVQDPVAAGHLWMGRLMRWLPRGVKPLATNMLLRDPPDHRRLRRLVEQAFVRQSVERLRPRLHALSEETLDRFLEQGRRSSSAVDLLSQFARPFPLAVITELLGLPPEDRPHFTRWAGQFSSPSSLFGVWRALFVGVRRLMQYIREEFRRQARQPRDGLMAALIQAEEAGDRLSEDELVAMVFLLLAAGHETTLHQIALSVVALLDHPDQLAQLKADWSHADSAVQELLRYISFAQFSKPRYALHDTEFYGQPIRKGEILFACLAAANSDPQVFPDPARLDLRREPNRHLAFGAGIHVCLGAPLARAEIAIALQRLFTRCPNLRLALPRSELRFSPRPGTRGLAALPVQW